MTIPRTAVLAATDGGKVHSYTSKRSFPKESLLATLARSHTISDPAAQKERDNTFRGFTQLQCMARQPLPAASAPHQADALICCKCFLPLNRCAPALRAPLRCARAALTARWHPGTPPRPPHRPSQPPPHHGLVSRQSHHPARRPPAPSAPREGASVLQAIGVGPWGGVLGG